MERERRGVRETEGKCRERCKAIGGVLKRQEGKK